MPLALPSLSCQLHGLVKYTISLKVRTQKHQSPFFFTCTDHLLCDWNCIYFLPHVQLGFVSSKAEILTLRVLRILGLVQGPQSSWILPNLIVILHLLSSSLQNYTMSLCRSAFINRGKLYRFVFIDVLKGSSLTSPVWRLDLSST